MTNEEKAKAYDEMVQRVKELHEAGNDLTKKQMEIICPELAESEDERMLNKLIDHLDWHSNNRLTHEECDELRSWLKKKKEHQNNSDAREKALGRDLTFPQDKDKNLDEIAQDYVDGVKEYNPELTWDLMQTAVCYGYHYCEMKEQKPKQWKGMTSTRNTISWINGTGNLTGNSMKYIDADLLKTSLIHLGEEFPILTYDAVLYLIESLQQEQPEVDLEKELDQWRHEHFTGKRDGHYSGEYLERSSQLDIVRHFYELGRSTRKKE